MGVDSTWHEIVYDDLIQAGRVRYITALGRSRQIRASILLFFAPEERHVYSSQSPKSVSLRGAKCLSDQSSTSTGASDLGEIVAINMSPLTERGYLIDEFKYVLLLELDLEFLQKC